MISFRVIIDSHHWTVVPFSQRCVWVTLLARCEHGAWTTTYAELARVSGCSWRTVARSLPALRAFGLIRYVSLSDGRTCIRLAWEPPPYANVA